MKRLFLALFVLIFTAAFDASAQHYLVKRTVGAVEGQLSIGWATAANNIPNFGKSYQGVEADIEVRYNFAKIPIDVGLNFAVCSFNRGERYGSYAQLNKFASRTLMATSHYNFMQRRNVSPFAGIGAGVAWCDVMKDGSSKGVYPAVAPLLGVEFYEFIRVCLSYKIYEKANNHLVVGVGFVIGGKKRQ